MEWSGLLSWAITFLVIAVVAALFGFGSVAGTSADIAKWLFIIFIVLFIISIITHFMKRS